MSYEDALEAAATSLQSQLVERERTREIWPSCRTASNALTAGMEAHRWPRNVPLHAAAVWQQAIALYPSTGTSQMANNNLQKQRGLSDAPGQKRGAESLKRAGAGGIGRARREAREQQLS